MYYEIYTLIQNAVYGSIALTGWQELFLTIVASSCVLFAIAIPFVLVWSIIKMILKIISR